MIADFLPRRIGKRCRERYMNHLNPDLRKEEWSDEEESILLASQVELGNRWADIGKLLPGRSVNSIKNHWYSIARRQLLESATNGVMAPKPKKSKLEPTKKWTLEEAMLLKTLVDDNGPRKWLYIASHIPGRTDLQCMQHWQHVLNPRVIKGKGSWTEVEDKILIEQVDDLGKKWSKVGLRMIVCCLIIC